MKILSTAAIVATLSLCSIASIAQESSFYIKGAFGQADLEDFDRESSFKLGGGYSLNENISVEVLYNSYGEPKESLIDDVIQSIAIETTGLSASVIGSLPVSDAVFLYGRAGLMSWDSDIVGDTSLGSVTISEDGVDFVVGVGVHAFINDKFSVALDYETFDVELFDVEGSLSTISVGAQFSF